MKRTLSLVLALLLLASATACGNAPEQTADSAGSTVSASPEVTEETEAPETEITDNLPEKDYEGRAVNLLTSAEQWQDLYNSEQTGEVMDDAVYERNLAVEDRFGVKLNYQVFNGYTAGMDAVKTALSGSVMSGGADYDLLVGSSSYITPLVADNLLADLYDAEYIDLNAPWWFSYINRELEIAGKLPVGAGSYGMLNYAWAVVTFFNKNLLTQYQLEDPYTLVQEGKWTWDAMMSLSEKVRTDTDGNQVYDQNDILGIASTWDYLGNFGDAMGCVYTEKNEDGSVTYFPMSEKLADVNGKLYKVINGDNYLDGYNMPGGDTTYTAMINAFAADHALFMIHRLIHVDTEAMRDMEGYGIIPLSKYDEAQDHYITPVVAEASGIPAVVADAEMSAILLEALQFETWKSVRPAYYDIALKGKYTQDEVSGQMLDLIFENATCSFAYMYTRFTDGYPASNLGQTEDYASWFASNSKKWQKKMNNLVESIREG
ncbi:MAG: extracellular solute-binding protein [Ruminococcaceae bacterium]|nr:extracellular solute-binding protein [Oscillospiraceae bacterium]